MELLIVEIEQAYLGIPTTDVIEVLRAARLAPSFGTNIHLKGMLNLRGAVLPVAALRTLLGLADRDVAATDHFIVLRSQSTTFAIHVDRAVEISYVSDSAVTNVDQPRALSVPHAEFGVVQIHRADSIWQEAGLHSAFDSQSVAHREGVSLS